MQVETVLESIVEFYYSPQLRKTFCSVTKCDIQVPLSLSWKRLPYHFTMRQKIPLPTTQHCGNNQLLTVWFQTHQVLLCELVRGHPRCYRHQAGHGHPSPMTTPDGRQTELTSDNVHMPLLCTSCPTILWRKPVVSAVGCPLDQAENVESIWSSR